MTNSFYNHTTYPVSGSSATSAAMRAELDSVTSGFNLLPTLAGHAGEIPFVNAAASAIATGASATLDSAGNLVAHSFNGNTVTTGTGTLTLGAGKTLSASDSTTLATNSITFGGSEVLALAAAKNVTFVDAFATSGAYSLTLTTTAATNVTLPTTGTLATLGGTEELTGKTLNASVGKGTWTASGTWQLPAFTAGDDVTVANGKSFKTDTTSAHTFKVQGYNGSAYVDLATVTNAATPSLTLAGPTISGTVLGTYSLGGTPTIGAATLSGTISGGGNQINNVVIGTSTPLAGSFTTIGATGKVTTVASAAGGAGLIIPPGAAPTSPVDGDLWTTTTGVYARINGATVGPLNIGTGTVTAVSVATANGVSGSSSGGATPSLTITLGDVTPSKVNGNTITTGTGTLTLGAGSSLVTSATNSITLTSTAATNVTLPTTGTLAILGANTFTALQTFLNTKDTVYNITDGAAFEIDPVNGNVQTVTLGASRTPKATNLAAGQSVLLGIDDGTAYTVTWTDGTLSPVWVKSGGTGAAPTLATSGYTWVLLWKVSTVVYGAIVGSP